MSAQSTSSQLLSRYQTSTKNLFLALNQSGVKKVDSIPLNLLRRVAGKQQPLVVPVNLSPQSDLDLFEQVLDEIENERTNNQVPADEISTRSSLKKPGLDLPPLDASPISSTKKEIESGVQASVEQGASIQVVETEKSPELSPEVEKYLQEVHEDKDRAPKEIAIVDEIANLPSNNQFVSEPVIVLPITPEIEKMGKRKSPKFSIRWLVEWSQKIIKMFAGKVIYLQAPSKE